MAIMAAHGKSGPPAFLTELESARLVRAIGDAERGNRGEVRVHLERRCADTDALARARDVFAKLGMHKTQQDTGVLLYVAIDDRRAAVFAGAGIHPAGAESFWQEVIDEVAKHFSEGATAAGLCHAVERIGELLREHVPGDDTAGNELPNAVTTS
jgi:uncharacterized membrane protein